MCLLPQQRALFQQLNFQRCSDNGVIWAIRCFAPQLHALFVHLNCQKCSGHVVFLAFWLQNVLCTTMTCTFSIFQLPKVLRAWCALHVLTWKSLFAPQRCALFRHHNFHQCSDVEVFLAFWPQILLLATTACNFWSLGSSPQMAPHPSLQQGYFSPVRSHKTMEKHSVTTFLPFCARWSSFFWLFLFSNFFFWLFLFSASVHPCCFICPHFGTLTSKFPSIIYILLTQH